MQYQIEFLDDKNTIVSMVPKTAENPATAFGLVVEKGWPHGARTVHVIDSLGQLTTFSRPGPGGPLARDELNPRD